MATNKFFRHQVNSEQDLVEDLTVEAIQIYGHDVIYIPRTLVNRDFLFGEDTISNFQQGINLEMYIASADGFEGEGDFASKFGIQIKDTVEFVVSKKIFSQKLSHETTINRPREGDLIYLPLSKGLFEIKFVEHENPFFQLNKLYTYSLSCELFQYSQEDIDTGWTDIDKIESDRQDFALNIVGSTGSGTYLVGEKVYQGASYATSTFNANVIKWTPATMTIQVAGISGSLNLALGLTGNDSSAFYSTGSTAAPATPTIVPPDPFSDNRDFQIEADDIFDFTDQDPFSEGNY